MRLNKTLQFAVSLARASIETGIPAATLAKMIAHVKASIAAYERETSVNTVATTKLRDKHDASVETLASEHGFSVCWSGLWPELVKGGREFRIPSYE